MSGTARSDKLFSSVRSDGSARASGHVSGARKRSVDPPRRPKRGGLVCRERRVARRRAEREARIGSCLPDTASVGGGVTSRKKGKRRSQRKRARARWACAVGLGKVRTERDWLLDSGANHIVVPAGDACIIDPSVKPASGTVQLKTVAGVTPAIRRWLRTPLGIRLGLVVQSATPRLIPMFMVGKGS